MKGRTALVLYDPKDALAQFAAARREYPREDFIVLALDYEVVLQCAQEGIPCLDLMEYHRTASRDSWMAPLNAMMGKWYEFPSMRFFEHKGEPLGRAYEWCLLLYLWRVFYYTDVFRWALQEYGTPTRVVIAPLPPRVSPTAAPHAQFEADAPVRVIEFEAQRSGIPVSILGGARPPGLRPGGERRSRFARAVSRAVFAVSNAVVSAFTQGRRVRIYTSEYWKNISSFVASVPDAEVMIMDRRDVFMLLPFLFSMRIRFFRPEDFLSRPQAREARRRSEGFAAAWRALPDTPDFADVFKHGGIDAWPLVRPLLEHLASADAERLLGELLGAETLYTALAVNRVLVRASVSVQTHFYALSTAARLSSIPCIELQHGVEHFAPGSSSVRRNAEYVAVYGPEARRQLIAGGFSQDKIFPIGSPRFDAYVRAPLPRQEPKVIVCILPEIGVEMFTTYDIARLLSMVGKESAGISCSIIFKLRPGAARKTFYERLIRQYVPHHNWSIADREPLDKLLAGASLVLSTFSTVILESVLAGVPVLLIGTQEMDRRATRFQFARLIELGGTRVLTTSAELAHAAGAVLADPREQVRAADAWLREAYHIEGRASERMVALISGRFRGEATDGKKLD